MLAKAAIKIVADNLTGIIDAERDSIAVDAGTLIGMNMPFVYRKPTGLLMQRLAVGADNLAGIIDIEGTGQVATGNLDRREDAVR
jgi:hypothetical protein